MKQIVFSGVNKYYGAFQALKESRWVQRRIRNALIWWDTLQIRRGKR